MTSIINDGFAYQENIALNYCGGKSLNWYIVSWALFEDMDMFEEEQMIRRGPKCRITKRKDEAIQSEEFILLGYKEHQSSRYLGNLSNPPGRSSDKDEIQAHAKMIRIQKYLEVKAAITALIVL